MEIYLDPEEKIMCPYNNSHHIRRKRMAGHLTKCKQNYSDTILVDCDFNVNHKIPEPELQYHHENCPDRKKIEITIYQDNKTDLNKYPVFNKHVPIEESWDNENCPTYDAQKYCESKEIIRHKDVASASVRRHFRMEERKRFRAFEEEQKNDTEKSEPHGSSASCSNSNYQINLPSTKGKHLKEETPKCIGDIVQRIKIGAKKSYIPQ